MKSCLATLLIVAATSIAHAADKAKKTAVEGIWTATKTDTVAQKLVFKGNAFEATVEGKVFKGTFKINADKKPQEIDMAITAGPEYVGKTALGLIKIEQGVLTWCSSNPGNKTRPTEFGGEGNLLATFKKAKK